MVSRKVVKHTSIENYKYIQVPTNHSAQEFKILSGAKLVSVAMCDLIPVDNQPGDTFVDSGFWEDRLDALVWYSFDFNREHAIDVHNSPI